MANRNAKKTAIRPIYTDKHIVYACSVINSRSFALLWICLHQFLLPCERGCVPRWKCVCLLYWKLYNFQLFHFALTRASGPFLGTFSQFFSDFRLTHFFHVLSFCCVTAAAATPHHFILCAAWISLFVGVVLLFVWLLSSSSAHDHWAGVGITRCALVPVLCASLWHNYLLLSLQITLLQITTCTIPFDIYLFIYFFSFQKKRKRNICI